MSTLHIEQTALSGVVILKPRRFTDDRGYFSEVWNAKALASAGFDVDFVQDNQSLSEHAGTVRGLHFQSPPHAQAKLVRVGRGRVFDVAVDLRKASPTYRRWVGVELSAENGLQLFIPKGFAHGFVTREPNTELLYKCSDHYAPADDNAIRFDDPDLAIDWGIPPGEARLSAKDASAPLLRHRESPF